jgi:glycolate oxidase iron-sulfur subunit
MLKDYGFLLREDPQYAAKAARVAAQARDISEVIGKLWSSEPPASGRQPARRNAGGPVPPLRVAYHSACSLQHGQKIDREPKELLVAAGFTVVDVPEGHLCCGSAGTYNLLEPEAARDLGDRKARNVLDAGAQLLVTANPGCHLQIQASLRRVGVTMPAAHVMELVDASVRGSGL